MKREPEEKHECVIGMVYDYDNTQLVTVEQLKEYIQRNCDLANWTLTYRQRRVFSLAEYCDRRYNTDLHRFDYCPYCGRYIQWKEIKEGNV